MAFPAEKQHLEQKMNHFKPDLVIEVTSVCNKACNGCYAPNVVSKDSAIELQKKDPSLFLGLSELQLALLNLGHVLPETISFRGGEPSLHPELPSIISLTRYFSQNLVLETHGRWLLKAEREKYQQLLGAIMANSVKIKISFDTMHRMRTSELVEIVSYLLSLNIEYYIAITESSEEDFSNTRSSISWVSEEKIFFQKKAISQQGMLKPRFGVIDSRGMLKNGLNTKFEMLSIDVLSLTAGTVAG